MQDLLTTVRAGPKIAALMATSMNSRRIDPFKLADQKASIQRSLNLISLPRVVEVVGESESQVTVEMNFWRDDQYRCVIQGHLETRANVVCERCLNPVEQPIVSDFTLCVVSSDEAARDVPREYDPLILTEQLIDVADIVEDEILLALPMFSYHADADCDQGMIPRREDQQDEEADIQSSEQKPNPFSVLSTLKLKK